MRGSADFRHAMTKIAEERENRRRNAVRIVKKISEQLFELGVKRVDVTYSGQNDDGEIDDVEYERLNPETKIPDELHRNLCDALWQLLPDGFVNDDGGFGQIALLTADASLIIDHSTRIVSAETQSEVIDLKAK